MEPIQYVGEHLWVSKAGNILVLFSFVCALLATFGFIKAANNNCEQAGSWKTIARTAFRIHSLSVLGIIGLIFYMLVNHMFEFHYIWQHSNKAMPMRYILSSFWEGQEGSFLLWTFWHIVLGNILMFTAKSWEAPVMAVFSSVQAFLASMLLGIYIIDYKIGSNPFTVLLREHPDFLNIPLFADPHYLKNLDGRGLNPLLQNYWMTIHPPTLFLGFASTLVPFAYAVAALWQKRYNEWLKPVLPWTYFGVMILGTGILMGGAWAYEALSFGGFWAWDPVENASLVPWITLVGAAHLMLIQKNKGTSLFSLFFLTLITFILILYSTFLTRSGVLGDASVHAFTDLGMSGQLLLYLLFFVVLSIVLLVINFKKFPKAAQEESTWSREFWMFIGALVLLISAFQITFTTSIPVINKVFGTSLAPPIEVIEHYNSWQVPFAVIIGILMAFTQFLKYKKTDFNIFMKKIVVGLGIAMIATVGISIGLQLKNPFYIALLFSSLFATIANLDYLIRVAKGQIKKAGASIAHIGFALILLGALLSTGKSDVISSNTSGVDISALDEEFDNRENILLFKDDTLQMGDYLVSYRGREKEGVNLYYQVDYYEKKGEEIKPAFTLHPIVQTNPRMGNVAEPDTRHFLDKDIYTHVTYAELEEREVSDKDYEEPVTKKLSVGDTLFAANCIITLEKLVRAVDKSQHGLKETDLVVGAEIRAIDLQSNVYTAMPLYVLRDTMYAYPMEDEMKGLGHRFRFEKIFPEENKVEITLIEKKQQQKEFIIMKAIVFPYINVLWLGCILMAIGTIIAIISRIRRTKND